MASRNDSKKRKPFSGKVGTKCEAFFLKSLFNFKYIMNPPSFLILGLSAVTLSGLNAAISVNSINTFDSDTESWVRPRSSEAPTFTPNLSFDGQPGYLINRSTASGAGNRWTMWNISSTWTGDYVGAGVTGISLWADNRSGVGSAVPLRLAFNGAGGWFVTDSITISDSILGNEWARYEFDITNLTHVAQGTGQASDTLSDVSAFQVLVADSTPTQIGGRGFIRADSSPSTDLRFDNIQAVGIPEPSSALLLGLAGLLTCSRRRRSL